MDENLNKMVKELLDSGMGDSYRLEHILNTLEKGKKLYNSDLKFLLYSHKQFEEKIDRLKKENENMFSNITKPSEFKADSHSHVLLGDEDLDRILDVQEKKRHQRVLPNEESIIPLGSKSKLSKIRKIFIKK